MIKDTNLRDSYYRQYKVDNPITDVDINKYMRIVSGFVKFILKKLFEGFEVRLAGGRSLGTLTVRGKKLTPIIQEDGSIRGLPTNWPETWKLWNKDPEAKAKDHRIYHLNEHTNGVKYKICWYTPGMRIANKHLYMLLITKGPRGIGRKLARALLDDNREYLVNVKREPYVRKPEESSEKPN